MQTVLNVLAYLLAMVGGLCVTRKQTGKHFVSLSNKVFNRIAKVHTTANYPRIALWYATRLCVVVLPGYVNHLGITTTKCLLLLNPYVLQGCPQNYGFTLGKQWAPNNSNLLGFYTITAGLNITNLTKYCAAYVKWVQANTPIQQG